MVSSTQTPDAHRFTWVGPLDLAAEQQRYYHDLLAIHGSDPTRSLAAEPRALHNAALEQRAVLERVIADNSDVYLKTERVKEELGSMLTEALEVTRTLENQLPLVAERTSAFKKAVVQNEERLSELETLLRHQDELLDVLEVPSLMEACVRAREYEAALELRAFVEKMRVLHGGGMKNKTLQSVDEGVGLVVVSMREQLLRELERDVSLTGCLQVVGTLKRVMRGDGEEGLRELRREFLERRGRWVAEGIPSRPVSRASGAAVEYIRGLTDVYRLQVGDVMMQYRAIFFGGGSSLPVADPSFSWASAKMGFYLEEMDATLPNVTDGTHLASVLDAVSYAGKGLARVGMDPRGRVLFGMIEDAVVRVFDGLVEVAEEVFEDMIAVHRWVAIPSTMAMDEETREGDGAARKEGGATSSVSPPMVLVSHGPLAVYTNGVLMAFNELRHCAPVEGVQGRVISRVERSIAFVERVLMEAGRPKGDEDARVYDDALKTVRDVLGPFLRKDVLGRVYVL